MAGVKLLGGGDFPSSDTSDTNTEKNHKIQKGKQNIKQKTKKRYRGKGKGNEDFSVLLTNLRGYKSKQMSLKKIVKRIKPKVVVMNETQMSGKMRVVLEPYQTWTKNREGKAGGGIATAVAPGLKDFAMGAGEGEQGDEWMVTRLDCFTPALNVVNCYGEQRKTKIEEVEAKWQKFRKQMESITARGEFFLLLGDLNKLVGSDELGVPGNHPEVSPGGRLLRQLLATEEWTLVNGMECVVGGPFTREDPATKGRSCLDLMVVSSNLRPFVKEMKIDSEKEITVSRVKKAKGKQEVVFSDHFSVLISFKNLPRKKLVEEKKCIWNLKKDNGWAKYHELTEMYSESLLKVIEDEHKTIEEKMNLFDKIDTKVKFKAFGKRTLGKTNKAKDTNESVAEDELEEKENKTEQKIKEIVNMKTGKANKVWEIRKRVLGGTKNERENSAIINPDTGKLAVTTKEIKTVSLKYCQETLKNNKPEDDYKEHIEAKKNKVAELMNMNDGEFSTSKETFVKMVKKV